jgi:dipeptidase E
VFAELADANRTVAVVMNAADVFEPSRRPLYFERERADMARIGLTATELDLRDYFSRHHDQLAHDLAGFGLVWVVGGNSFVLRRAMHQSGFDVVGREAVKSGVLAYGGYSAGAVVATPTLRHIDLDDDPRAIPDGYAADPIYDGLGLYDKSIAPHWRSDHPESEVMEQIVSRFEAESMPYQALRDGEAVVLIDGVERLLSTGSWS